MLSKFEGKPKFKDVEKLGDEKKLSEEVIYKGENLDPYNYYPDKKWNESSGNCCNK